MDLTRNIEFLDRAIASQRAAQRFHVSWALGVAGLGLGVVMLAHILAGSVVPENLKWILTLGGGFVSTLPGFPLILGNRRDKIAALTFLRSECERIQGSKTPPDPREAERVEGLFWQFVGKSLGG